MLLRPSQDSDKSLVRRGLRQELYVRHTSGPKPRGRPYGNASHALGFLRRRVFTIFFGSLPSACGRSRLQNSRAARGILVFVESCCTLLEIGQLAPHKTRAKMTPTAVLLPRHSPGSLLSEAVREGSKAAALLPSRNFGSRND